MDFKKSTALYERSKKSLAGGVSSQARIGEKPVPLFFESGKGSKLYDVDGNKYIDYQMANGPAFFGHSPDFLLEAVNREMQRFQLFAGQHELEIRVSELVQQAVPCAELVRYNSSGTEAVQSALRMARAYTGRNNFIKFEGHYHGWMDSVLYSTFHPPLDRIGPYESPVPVPVSAGQSRGTAQEVITLPWNDLDLLTTAVEKHSSDLAAIIMEPIACNVNSALPKPGYLEGVRKLCNDSGIVLIFDEVITGFRIGLGGAQGYLGVTPDMGVFAKAMAGGFPISMVAATKEIMTSLEDSTTVLAGTYNSNVMVMAAAEASINKLMENDGAVYRHVYSVGNRLIDGLRGLARTHEEDVLVQGLGPAFHMIFTAENELPDYRSSAQNSDSKRYARFRVGMLENGVRLMDDGRWFLSSAHTEEDIDRTLEIADKTFRSL